MVRETMIDAEQEGSDEAHGIRIRYCLEAKL